MLVSSSSILAFALWSWFFFVPVYLREHGFSTLLIGVVCALGSIASVVMPVLGGFLSDLIGRKAVILLASTFFVVSHCTLMIFNPLAVATAYILAHVASGIGSGASLALISESTDRSYRARALALHYSSTTLAGIPGPLIGGLLSTSSRSLLFTTALALSIIALILRIFLRETTRRQKPSRNLSSHINDLKNHFAILLRGGTLLQIVLIVAFIYYTGVNLVLPYIPVFAREVLKLSDFEIGLVYTCAMLALGISSLYGGYLADKVSRLQTLQLSLLFTSITLPLIVLSKSLAHLIATFTIFCGVAGIGVPALRTVVADIARSEERGLALGSLVSIMNTASAIGALIGGILYDIAIHLDFIIASLIVLLATIIVVIKCKLTYSASSLAASM